MIQTLILFFLAYMLWNINKLALKIIPDDVDESLAFTESYVELQSKKDH